MRDFLISDLENLSGIKAYIIRTWEHRYQLLQPNRGKGNIRSYSVKDLEFLLKISLLNKSGSKISKLAKMNADTVDKNLEVLHFEEDRYSREVHKLIVSMFKLDTEEFDRILDHCMLSWGIDSTFKDIIVPFLVRTQIFSCKKCNYEVDLAITAIRRKIIVGTEKVVASSKRIENKTALLFLPEGEYFDLMLLYFNYIMKCLGINVLYMGTNVSIQKLKMVSIGKKPDFLLTYMSSSGQKGLSQLVDYLNEEPGVKCFITAFENNIVKEVKIPNMKYLHYSEPDVISEFFR